MRMIFTLAEKNLMIIYNTGTRLGLMTELGHMLGYLHQDEKELHDMTVSVIKKLKTITDEDFAALNLDPGELKGW